MLYAGMECIRSFMAIVCTKEGEIIRKGRIKTDETAIKEFFYGLRDVKVANRSIYKL